MKHILTNVQCFHTVRLSGEDVRVIKQALADQIKANHTGLPTSTVEALWEGFREIERVGRSKGYGEVATIKRYIEWLHHARFFAEPVSEEVPEDYVVPKVWPKGALGYRFYTRQEIESDGEILRGKAQNYTPWVYRGVVRTLEEVEALPGDNKILLTNMQCNGWDRVVFVGEPGPVYPLLEGETVVPLEEAK